MQQIILNEKLTLAFEPLDKKLRLIILKTDEELVCRKETIKNLIDFLSADCAHIFKGRLQLKKKDSVVEVLVKDELVGVIALSNFKEVLETMDN